MTEEEMDEQLELMEEYDNDRCYECTGYGDNYSYDEDGELVSNCIDCPWNRANDEWME